MGLNIFRKSSVLNYQPSNPNPYIFFVLNKNENGWRMARMCALYLNEFNL